jgi:hypothetical protein
MVEQNLPGALDIFVGVYGNQVNRNVTALMTDVCIEGLERTYVDPLGAP